MTLTSPSLIVRTLPAGTFTSLPTPSPNTLMVLSYTDGRVAAFSRRVTIGDRRGSANAYIVDISDHGGRAQLRLPARGDIYHFLAIVGVAWRVVDSAEIVRRNITDGEFLAMGYVESLCRPVTRRHAAEDTAGAEEEIIARVQIPVRLAEGIEITSCSVRLAMDQQIHGRATGLDALGHQHAVETLEGVMTRDRVTGLRQLVDGDDSLVLIHLANHPNDTATIINLVAESRARDEESRQNLLASMLEKNLIKDYDVERILNKAVGSPGPGAAQVFGQQAALQPAQRAAPPPSGNGWVDAVDQPPESAADGTARHGGQGSVVGWKTVGRANRTIDQE